MSAFDEIKELESRVEEITRDLEVRTDYESLIVMLELLMSLLSASQG